VVGRGAVADTVAEGTGCCGGRSAAQPQVNIKVVSTSTARARIVASAGRGNPAKQSEGLVGPVRGQRRASTWEG
jgi:hypothetical protein